MDGAAQWLGEWVSTPGFGGAAAVGAALLAYLGATRERRASDARAREARWWEQARWAAGLLASQSQQDVALGIAALDQLVDEAADVEAAVFALQALELTLSDLDTSSAPPEAQMVDRPEHSESSWDEEP